MEENREEILWMLAPGLCEGMQVGWVGGRGRVKEGGRRVWKKSGNWIEGREERRKGEEGGKGREEKRGVREKDRGGGDEGRGGMRGGRGEDTSSL